MSAPQLSTKEYALKLYDMLKPSGWHDVLKGFLLSEDFVNIIKTLETCVEDGNRFTPPLKDVFNAFLECPYDKTRVILLGEGPSPILGVADGLTWSCGNTKVPDKILTRIFEEINRTVYLGKKDITIYNPDLRRWSKQGVLLLNTALTTQIDKHTPHYSIWEPLIVYLIDMLNVSYKDYVWMFVGNANKHTDLIDDVLNHTKILSCISPVVSTYIDGEKTWNSDNIFNDCNKYLLEIDKSNKVIIW